MEKTWGITNAWVKKIYMPKPKLDAQRHQVVVVEEEYNWQERALFYAEITPLKKWNWKDIGSKQLGRSRKHWTGQYDLVVVVDSLFVQKKQTNRKPTNQSVNIVHQSVNIVRFELESQECNGRTSSKETKNSYTSLQPFQAWSKFFYIDAALIHLWASEGGDQVFHKTTKRQLW